jgi:dTMP kinase
MIKTDELRELENTRGLLSVNGRRIGNRRGKFIVLDGIDGSGKSTITKLVAERLQDASVVQTRYKEIATTSPELETGMRQLDAILWPPTQDHLRHLPSRYRVLLHAAWVSLVSDAVVAPRIASGETLLFDGWCYKIMARFVVDGYSEDYIKLVFSSAGEPDDVILLQPDVELVWSRAIQNGRRFSRVEMGLYQGHTELGKDTFISYQSRTRDAILALAKMSGRNVIVLDANGSIEETAAEVESIVRELLA